jgi:hypothetical protein
VTDDHDHVLYQVEKQVSFLPPMTQLLLSTDLKEMTRILRDRKIPIRTEDELSSFPTEAERLASETQSLMRWNGIVAWVIGTGEDKDLRYPQLWFEKDTFLPLRFVYEDKSEGQLVDFRFDGYRFQKEFAYPRTISFGKRKGGTFISSNLVELSINSEAGSKVHDNSGDTGFKEAGHAAPSALKNLIRLYYKVAR